MDKKLAAMFLLIVVVLAPLGVLAYGYANFSDKVYPDKEPLKRVLVKVPYNGVEYRIALESYNTGDPFLDLNLTLRGTVYESMTLIVGDPMFRECDAKALGDVCIWRTRTVTEIAAVLSPVFTANRYWYYKEKGYDENESMARAQADVERIHTTSLGFIQKVKIGLGLMGDKKHLLVLLKGPAEGGKVDRIYSPKEGIMVLEATSERTLFAEVLLLKTIIASRVK
ncbi:hypothetical protein NF865_09925 [Thermococcus aggregans]|uniref:Uncharacterized protein n=1 Tax=Thermococcus aggregans TaxID=110163 RepID=A0A9E7MXJ4_THEAG|nr:hypothetical protein [Thermococcus aggregans]USS40596.1 hypothetical protein NF865_09925 [Thermococcus aggregans]